MTDKLDLAVIGNSVVGALLDKRARIVWYCLPRFDGDPFFSSLMDKDDAATGFADVEMADLASTEQAYARNTAILTTVLTDTRGGQIRITDFVPRFKRFERVYRPRMVVRRIEPVQGLCMVRLRVRPNFAWGSTQPTRTVGSNHLRYVGPDFTVRLTTDAPISFIEEEAQFALSAPIHMIFGPDETIEESPSHIFGAFHERTMEYWIDWTRYLSVPFEYQDAIIRSAITLKLCNFEDSGAIVAALTTSIPEAPDSGRNWDYRYCWLRDAYFVVQALNQLGATRTMEDYLNYITTVIELEHGGDIKPVYGILPDQSLEERVITSLPGFKGMGPVRVGNQAYIQHQYEDAYWQKEPAWNVHEAALQGSSYYDLPRPLHWLTAYIGFHHIHHLSTKVPNYRLYRCYHENPELQQATRLTIRSSLGCWRLALWDEDRRKLVPFAAVAA